MKRREFIALMGGTAASPLLAPLPRAQQPRKLPTIGFLGTHVVRPRGRWTAAFAQRLHELGWIEGRTVAIEYRWANGRTERYAEIAAEFVRLKVDVIVTSASAVARGNAGNIGHSHRVHTAPDPVGSGWSQSWRDRAAMSPVYRPQALDLAVKRLEILREVVPNLRRLAILANPSLPFIAQQMREIAAAARTLGLEVATLGNSAIAGYRARLRGAQGPH